MDLEDVTAELLALPPDQFTSSRTSRAKELKASGEAELANQVSKLKKPPVYLWAANQVGRGEPALMRNIQDGARAVAKAQTGPGAGTARDLRTASEAFQAALDAASQAASNMLEHGGHAASEDALRRVREIFRMAALNGGETWDRLRKGALIDEPSAGDDVLSMFQAAAPAPKEKGRKPDREAEDPHAARAAERTARMDAERADQLEDVARRLRSEADDAAEQAKRADERARAAEKQAADARKQAAKSARALPRA